MYLTGIEDKYELIDTLQETAATAVLLVRHKQIGDIRILKAVQKSHPNGRSILSEANLLSGLKSPELPTIYDVGQTDDYYYLIEEYIDGQTLKEYLLKSGRVSLSELIDIFVRLCEILEILHEDKNDPILYRDMKPEHIILQNGRVRLIDFGIAIRQSQSDKAFNFCTKKYASPEQLRGDKLDCSCDVYGIGMVIKESLEYLEKKEIVKLNSIALRATSLDREKRISTVSELKQLLKTIEKELSYAKTTNKRLNRNIAVVSNTNSVGCTHIAINVCKGLNDMKHCFYYESKDSKNTVMNLTNNISGMKIKDGVLYHKGFRGLIEYGPAVKQQNPPVGNYIYDYGATKEKPIDADYIIYVIGLRPWYDLSGLPDWVLDDNVVLVANLADKLSIIQMSKRLKRKIFVYPVDSIPFNIASKEKRILEKISKDFDFD